MLAKLLKYEIPAMGRRLLPLYAAWAATALLLGIATQSSASKSDFAAVMAILLYVAVATAIAVMTVVMIVQRYSGSLLGDEAYFNHVLPVSVSAHIGNKLISATIWVVVTALVALLTGVLALIGVGIVGGFEGFDMAYIDIPKRFWLYAIEMLLIIISGIVKTVMQIYAAVTIGHQAQNHTMLASIGAYIGVLVFEATLAKTLSALVPSLGRVINESGELTSLTPIFAAGVTIAVFFSAIYFFVCKYLMEKRLNLA